MRRHLHGASADRRHRAETTPPGVLIGRQHGSYRFDSLLGAGGMGEVYRAHDEKLGRDVAIKTLPPEFARDPARVARFRREARTLAALNHPNIAAIYELEESEDVDYLVLELVQGESPRGPVPLAAALDISSQVADALQTAHEHGIVHRDLKPANLKVTPQGRVKILDFGLAKAVSDATDVVAGQPAEASSGRGSTALGLVVGTPGYMSPEQARGAVVDQRTDIWAFGCLLYELLAGMRAFECATVAGTVSAVLNEEPDWRSLPARMPSGVRTLLRQCLQKDPSRRLGSMAEARATIEALRRGHERSKRRPAVARVRSVAVLPLGNVSGDPEQEYFADGMTEALISELAQIRALRVISRTSAMHYKGTSKTIPQIATELGVDGVIEGSVMRSGDRVRITAQLIHAATDRHLWAHSYERERQDVLQLQGDVARAIADEIQVTVTPQERARLSRVHHVNVASHEAYIRGHYHWGRLQLNQSVEHFKRAIALDPGNAAAYAGLGDALCMLFGAAQQLFPPAQVAPQAREAALKALELDENLAEPHVTLSRVLFWYDRDFAGAEREIRRAISVNPNCAMAHFIHGMHLGDLRRNSESIAAYRRALQLDPVSCWNTSIAGIFFYESGCESEGKEQIEKGRDLDPLFYMSWTLMGIVHCIEGEFSQAIAEVQHGVRLSSGLPLALGMAAYVLGIAGRADEARTIIGDLLSDSGHRYVSGSSMAWAYLGLRDFERAMEWLEVGYEQRDSFLPHCRVFRAFRPLDPDPRFQNLLSRLAVAP